MEGEDSELIGWVMLKPKKREEIRTCVLEDKLINFLGLEYKIREVG